MNDIPIEKATPNQIQQFMELLKEGVNREELQKNHLCWFFIPSLSEWERMRKFALLPNFDKCPKCKKGRIVIEIFRDSICESWTAKCKWGLEGCDFFEYISDDM